VAQRRRTLDVLALRPGERVADLGCGPGLLALDMARQVGPGGEVHCIDASDSMLTLAKGRLADLPHVHVHEGDVTSLPYTDESLDVVVSTQVYEYVTDLDRALEELRRVLKPGGRAMILDTDWESCVWSSSDPQRMRRVIEAWDRHCAHPHLPRTLARRLGDASLNVERIEVVALINDRYEPNTFSHAMIPTIASWAKRHLDQAEVAAWAQDLRGLGERGDYFFSLNRYLFLAHRPAHAR